MVDKEVSDGVKSFLSHQKYVLASQSVTSKHYKSNVDLIV